MRRPRASTRPAPDRCCVCEQPRMSLTDACPYRALAGHFLRQALVLVEHVGHDGANEVVGLAREAIGLREVLFQSITHMAPAAAVAFSIIAGAGFAGGALPLAVILALIGCLLVAISIGELAKHLPSAGSFCSKSVLRPP